MKKQTKDELRSKTIDDLRKLIQIKRKELMSVNIQVKNNRKLSGHPKRIKKEIAVIHTIIHEKINKLFD